MYCNPKVYNFSNLGKEHQAIFETMLNQTSYLNKENCIR